MGGIPLRFPLEKALVNLLLTNAMRNPLETQLGSNQIGDCATAWNDTLSASAPLARVTWPRIGGTREFRWSGASIPIPIPQKTRLIDRFVATLLERFALELLTNCCQCNCSPYRPNRTGQSIAMRCDAMPIAICHSICKCWPKLLQPVGIEGVKVSLAYTFGSFTWFHPAKLQQIAEGGAFAKGKKGKWKIEKLNAVWV